MTEWLWRSGAWRSVRSGVHPPPPPPPGAWKGLDSTAYIPDPGWFVSRFTEGFRLYCLHSTEWGGTAPWWRTEPQLAAALDAGLRIGVYTRDPTTWRAGIDACGPYVNRLQFFALDVETEGPTGGPGQQVTRAMVDGVRSLGVRPVIYTGSGMWPVVMGGNVTAFSDVPLWDTDTSSPPLGPESWTPDLAVPAPVRYGGWNEASRGTMRRIVQQAFDMPLGGVSVDLNAVDPAFLEDR